MKWRDEYLIGIDKIDEQHKRLFEISEVLDKTNEINEVKDILLYLKEYMEFHFVTEESLMEKYKYEGLEEHKQLHKD